MGHCDLGLASRSMAVAVPSAPSLRLWLGFRLANGVWASSIGRPLSNTQSFTPWDTTCPSECSSRDRHHPSGALQVCRRIFLRSSLNPRKQRCFLADALFVCFRFLTILCAIGAECQQGSPHWWGWDRMLGREGHQLLGGQPRPPTKTSLATEALPHNSIAQHKIFTTMPESGETSSRGGRSSSSLIHASRWAAPRWNL